LHEAALDDEASEFEVLVTTVVLGETDSASVEVEPSSAVGGLDRQHARRTRLRQHLEDRFEAQAGEGSGEAGVAGRRGQLLGGVERCEQLLDAGGVDLVAEVSREEGREPSFSLSARGAGRVAPWPRCVSCMTLSSAGLEKGRRIVGSARAAGIGFGFLRLTRRMPGRRSAPGRVATAANTAAEILGSTVASRRRATSALAPGAPWAS
jgi:hypothetical protein